MKTKNESNICRVHQGHNLSTWRKEHNVDPEVFANQLGITVEDVSQIEMSRIIPSELLKKIVILFRIPLESITERVEPFPSTMTVTNTNTFTSNGSVNGVNECSGACWNNTTFTNSPTIHPIDKVCELFDRLLHEKDRMQQDFERRLSELEKK